MYRIQMRAKYREGHQKTFFQEGDQGMKKTLVDIPLPFSPTGENSREIPTNNSLKEEDKKVTNAQGKKK